MDPIVFEVLGSLLVGGMIWLTVFRRGPISFSLFHRPKHSQTQNMPMLAIRKTRSASSIRRHKSSPTRVKNKIAAPKTRKLSKVKVAEPTVESGQGSSPPSSTIATLNSCPSCGLQAPETLLAEHFNGSPSHRNGPPKSLVPDVKKVEAEGKAKEDDSNQSVRDLMQILVPPRAFGLRHAHRSGSMIPSVVQDLGPRRRHAP